MLGRSHGRARDAVRRARDGAFDLRSRSRRQRYRAQADASIIPQSSALPRRNHRENHWHLFCQVALFLNGATLESDTMTKPNVGILRPFLTVVALLAAAMLSGCSGGGPKKAAQNYTDNLKLFNYPACYQALSHQD